MKVLDLSASGDVKSRQMAKKRGRGRPTVYRSRMCDRVILCGSKGMTRHEISRELNIAVATLQNWEKVHPEFLAATTRARELSQAWWEEWLRKNASNRDANGQLVRLIVTNQFPGTYRDVQRVEHSGPEGKSIEVNTMNRDEILEELKRRNAVPAGLLGAYRHD